MKFDAKTYRLTEKGKFEWIAGGIGMLGLVLTWVAVLTDWPRLAHAHLTAAVFWTSLGLGGLFFTMLHHLTNAKWSVALRRISENLMLQLPLMALAFLPILFDLHDLYHWSHEEAVAHDAILQAKSGYLNAPFFVVRTVGYFVIWSVLAFALYRVSLKQDKGHTEEHRAKMRKLSAIGMLLFAPTITFASYDWLMSIEPHWFSTIFGVYFFGGVFFGFLALLTGICVLLRQKNVLRGIVTREHFHDLGKFMLGFVIFWSYIGFSQYFLIWYGNVPEETYWYLMRWEGSWKTVSMILILGHFALPFVVLLFQRIKRSMTVMAIVSIWFLVVHWIDLYWLVYPTFMKEGAGFTWIEVAPMMLIGGVFMVGFWRRMTSQPVVPVGDPHLKTSIEHTT